MKTYTIPYNLSYVGHERSHADCLANVTVRIPDDHVYAVIDPERTTEYDPQEWVITAISIDKDTKPYLATLFTNEAEICLAILHWLMDDIEAFDEFVGEHLWDLYNDYE